MSRELCIMACVFCRDKQFQEWAYQQSTDMAITLARIEGRTEACAKSFILHVSNVTSRNDLDIDAEAAQRFHDLVRKPFLAWKEGRRDGDA